MWGGQNSGTAQSHARKAWLHFSHLIGSISKEEVALDANRKWAAFDFIWGRPKLPIFASLSWIFFSQSIGSLPTIKTEPRNARKTKYHDVYIPKNYITRKTFHVKILQSTLGSLGVVRTSGPSLTHVNLPAWRNLAVSHWDWLNRVSIWRCQPFRAKQRFLFIKHGEIPGSRKFTKCHLYFRKVFTCKVLAARQINLITARACQNKRTACMLTNARKDHSSTPNFRPNGQPMLKI